MYVPCFNFLSISGSSGVPPRVDRFRYAKNVHFGERKLGSTSARESSVGVNIEPPPAVLALQIYAQSPTLPATSAMLHTE